MRSAIAALVAAVAAAQLWLAHRYFGFLTGDEVEVLGEAFRRARGFAYVPWQVRNLLVPDVLVAPAVWAASRIGIDDVGQLIFAAALPFIALTALTVWMLYRIGGFLPALLFATHWIPLAFGSTTYPRTLAACCVVAAALLVERWPFAAGVLAGLAFADRFSEIVFLIPLLIVARRRLQVAAGAAVSIALAGAYDWLTYGAPFSSFIDFARLTLVAPDFASRVKYQAPWWYLASLTRWLAPTLLPALWFARRHRLWWFVLIPFVAFSAVRHKELRYLQVLIPFVMIIAASGMAMIWRRHRAVAIALLAISIVWDLYGLRYFARKSQPAVMAARALRGTHTVVLSQLWAYGDRLYLGDRTQIRDVGTPPRDLDHALPGADAAALWETDLDDAGVRAALARWHFTPAATYRDGPARAVVVFRAAATATR
jgi:phosphatidylinositol glycan class B